MLYDILFIDDDFGKSNQSEVKDLYIKFTKKRYRVAYTTGEQEDLQKFTKTDLSSIKFVFCDLHLAAINRTDHYKTINSNLYGIFLVLKALMNEENIVVYVNSDYINQEYGQRGLDDLRHKCDQISSGKFKVCKIDHKNMLPNEELERLEKVAIAQVQRSLILEQTIKIEKIINNIIGLPKEFIDFVTLDSKIKIFNEHTTELEQQGASYKEIRKHISLLKEIRNAVAHRDNLDNLKKDNLKIIYKIIHTNTNSIPMPDNYTPFNNFDELFRYTNSLLKLADDIRYFLSRYATTEEASNTNT